MVECKYHEYKEQEDKFFVAIKSLISTLQDGQRGNDAAVSSFCSDVLSEWDKGRTGCYYLERKFLLDK